jgi:hypothetical protein
MAHSIQTFRSRDVNFNDLDLMVIICLLQQEVSNAPERYRLVRPLVARWRANLVLWGPGTIDLELADIESSEDGIAELRSLFVALNDALEKMGTRIDGGFLNASCSVPGVVFNDYSTAILKEAVSGLMTLLD